MTLSPFYSSLSSISLLLLSDEYTDDSKASLGQKEEIGEVPYSVTTVDARTIRVRAEFGLNCE